MDVPTLDVSYTSATTGRGDHEVHKGHVVALGEKNILLQKEIGYDKYDKPKNAQHIISLTAEPFVRVRGTKFKKQ
jgi:ribosomal protein L27